MSEIKCSKCDAPCILKTGYCLLPQEMPKYCPWGRGVCKWEKVPQEAQKEART